MSDPKKPYRLWLQWILYIILSVSVLLILGLVSSTLYFWYRLRLFVRQNDDKFDISKVVNVCGPGCISPKNDPKIKIFLRKTPGHVTISYNNLKWNIDLSTLSKSESDIRSTFTFFGTKLGAYLSPCRLNTLSILNLSQPGIQRFCYDYSSDEVFLTGPLNTPTIHINGSS